MSQQQYVQLWHPEAYLVLTVFQVQFANEYNLPFLATNEGHGTAPAISNIKKGVNIYVHALNGIQVAADGQSALLGGGTYLDEVIKELALHDKVAGTDTPKQKILVFN